MREICTSGSTRGRWATDLFCYPPSYSTGHFHPLTIRDLSECTASFRKNLRQRCAPAPPEPPHAVFLKFVHSFAQSPPQNAAIPGPHPCLSVFIRDHFPSPEICRPRIGFVPQNQRYPSFSGISSIGPIHFNSRSISRCSRYSFRTAAIFAPRTSIFDKSYCPSPASEQYRR